MLVAMARSFLAEDEIFSVARSRGPGQRFGSQGYGSWRMGAALSIALLEEQTKISSHTLRPQEDSIPPQASGSIVTVDQRWASELSVTCTAENSFRRRLALEAQFSGVGPFRAMLMPKVSWRLAGTETMR